MVSLLHGVIIVPFPNGLHMAGAQGPTKGQSMTRRELLLMGEELGAPARAAAARSRQGDLLQHAPLAGVWCCS
jgi:hypothetical protein